MIRDYKKLFWTSIAILIVVLGARLIWLTVTTETGFQELRREWWDANTAWIVGSTVPLDNRPTADQEDFWIREIDRILQVHGDDPQVLVGAAVLLDAPIASAWGDNDGIRERLMRQEVIPDEPQEYYSGPNIRIGSGSKSLELIAKATELNPGNSDWWQIRALLATSPDYYTANGRRDQNLVATLDECLQHDPKNALYDYLATEVEWSPHRYSNPFNRPTWLIEKDAESISRCLPGFERGLSLPSCTVGDAGYIALSKFLSHSSLPLSEQKYLLRSCEINRRLPMLLMDLGRFQVFRSPEVYRDNDKKSIIQRYRQCLRLSEQIRSGRKKSDLRFTEFEIEMLRLIRETAQSISLDLSTQEGDEFQEAEYDARLNQQIEFELVRRLEVNENQDLYKWANVFGTFSTSVKLAISVAASTVLPAGIASFFIMGVLTSIASRRLRCSENSSLGVLKPTLTMLGALTFTVVVFGLFPAGIANVEQVGKIIKILIQVAIPVLLMFVIFDRLQKRNFRFGIPETMVFILLVAVVMKLSMSAQRIVDCIPTLSFHVTPRFWNYHPEELINTPTVYDLGPLDAAYQWIAYGGPYLTMVCWLLLIMISALWLFIRQKICKKPVPSQSLRSILAALMQTMTRICFATSAVLLIAYLVIAPAHILSIEKSYQREIASFRDPNKYWSQIEKSVDEIRADEAFMGNASAHVKAEMGI